MEFDQNEEINSDEETNTICTPEEIAAKAKEAIEYSSLPEKSKPVYKKAYDLFADWKRSKKIPSTLFSEIIAYFQELSEKYAPPTLWNPYSLLRATINHYDGINISNYNPLKLFIKRKNLGYISKKAQVFSPADVTKFLEEAPDQEWLLHKVVMIFGITGAMRSGDELTNVRIHHIKPQGSLLVVDVPKTKTKKLRTFVIPEEFTDIVKKYSLLRPSNTPTDRFFLNFTKGKCTRQVIGKNKFAKLPNETATYLRLPEPKKYTGHSYRRTSATLLANSNANLMTIKRHGGWTSTASAERYIEDSIEYKKNTGNIIASALRNSSKDSRTSSLTSFATTSITSNNLTRNQALSPTPLAEPSRTSNKSPRNQTSSARAALLAEPCTSKESFQNQLNVFQNETTSSSLLTDTNNEIHAHDDFAALAELKKSFPSAKTMIPQQSDPLPNNLQSSLSEVNITTVAEIPFVIENGDQYIIEEVVPGDSTPIQQTLPMKYTSPCIFNISNCTVNIINKK